MTFFTGVHNIIFFCHELCINILIFSACCFNWTKVFGLIPTGDIAITCIKHEATMVAKAQVLVRHHYGI